jgi:cyclic beta-1,2-glucan synthetase
VSRPRPQAVAPTPCRRPIRDYLLGVARDTWRLFERCVVPEDHHLPPDNLQIAPHDMVAHRTSPTNIGLYLLATMCARKFGWIGSRDALDRLEATLSGLQALPRHRGHFLNWYDTERAQALLPQYVSSVDSGNLCMHLLAVAQACFELEAAPDDDSALRRELARSRACIDALRATSDRPLPAGALAALLDDADPLTSLAADLPGATRAARRCARRVARLGCRRSRAASADGPQSRLAWAIEDRLATLRSGLRDRDGTADAKARLGAVIATCQRLAREADFGFLYNRKRRLFHIGFRVAEHQLDAGFYDLLASEARATSLWAIAKGDVPAAHWAALGRPLMACGDLAGLRSWSGSMFEYLMPPLVLDEPHGSVLHSASRAAVAEQIAYGRRHHVPWGISESAYAGSDHTLAYQYAPQGVPASPCAARRSTSWWSRPTPPPSPPRSRRTAPPPTCAVSRRRRRAAATASSKRSTTRRRASRATRAWPGSRPSWRITRA